MVTGGVEPPVSRSSGGRSSAERSDHSDDDGVEPAPSTLTGWRTTGCAMSSWLRCRKSNPDAIVMNSHVPCQLGDTGSNVRDVNQSCEAKSLMPYKNVADERAAARRRYGRNDAIRKISSSARVKCATATGPTSTRSRPRPHVLTAAFLTPPYVMQFDHLGEDKDRDIATLTRSPVSLARLMVEIAKCEVVCANCHAERTHERRVVVAQEGLEPSSPGL